MKKSQVCVFEYSKFAECAYSIFLMPRLNEMMQNASQDKIKRLNFELRGERVSSGRTNVIKHITISVLKRIQIDFQMT